MFMIFNITLAIKERLQLFIEISHIFTGDPYHTLVVLFGTRFGDCINILKTRRNSFKNTIKTREEITIYQKGPQ